MLLNRKSVNSGQNPRAARRRRSCPSGRSRVKFKAAKEAIMKSNDHPKREEKKKPAKTLKEKREEKKTKKDQKSAE
jgi:hypothetical protein